MRRGECLGLRWTDLDLAAGRASIVQTVIAVNHEVRFGSPKTARGRRTVVLDPSTVTALREHRQRQQLAERLLMGVGFTDHGLVFCRPDGGPLHPERFSRTFSIEASLRDCLRSGCTIFGTPGRHSRYPLENIRRLSRRGSGTLRSRSLSTCTATSRMACKATPHPASQDSFSGVR
jgi:hypothetical protein